MQIYIKDGMKFTLAEMFWGSSWQENIEPMLNPWANLDLSGPATLGVCQSLRSLQDPTEQSESTIEGKKTARGLVSAWDPFCWGFCTRFDSA